MAEIKITPDGRSILVTTKKADVKDWAWFSANSCGLKEISKLSNKHPLRHPAYKKALADLIWEPLSYVPNLEQLLQQLKLGSNRSNLLDKGAI